MGKKVLTAYERALEEGELRGELKKALETARKMRDEGDSLEKILRISELSENQLRENGILWCSTSPPLFRIVRLFSIHRLSNVRLSLTTSCV